MRNIQKQDELNFLYNAILKIETLEECKKFFDDLCSIQEINEMSQRILVAKMLKERNVYSQITKETGASTATISRVNRSLNYGAGGYSLILDRLMQME